MKYAVIIQILLLAFVIIIFAKTQSVVMGVCVVINVICTLFTIHNINKQ